VDRALTLVQDRVVTEFMHDPSVPAPLDLSPLDPSLLVDAPDQLLVLSADLLLRGDTARGGQYLDLLEHARSSIPPKSSLANRLGAGRLLPAARPAQGDKAVRRPRAGQATQGGTQPADDWNAVIPLTLVHAYAFLEDFPAVAREAAAALAMPGIPEPVKL